MGLVHNLLRMADQRYGVLNCLIFQPLAFWLYQTFYKEMPGLCDVCDGLC